MDACESLSAHIFITNTNTVLHCSLHQLMSSDNETKCEIYAISALPNLIAELSLKTTWHMTYAHDKCPMCCT